MQANGQRKLPLNSGSVRAGYGLRLGPQVFPLQWLAAETRDWRASGWLAEGGIADEVLFRIGIAARRSVPFRNQAGAERPHAATELASKRIDRDSRNPSFVLFEPISISRCAAGRPSRPPWPRTR